MKIVFDSKIFFSQKFGGSSRYYSNLFESLNYINLDTFIVSPFYINNYLERSEYKKNIYGLNVPKIKFTGSILSKINSSLSNFFIKKIKPDIIHTTDYFENYTDNFNPLVVTIHDLIHEIFHFEYAKGKDYRPKERILKLADQIICVSKNTKKDLLKYYKVDEKKVRVIYHGCNFSYDTQILNIDNNVDINFKYFLYVGSRKRYKNFFLLIEDFKKNKQIYNEFKIICFGGGELLKSEKKILKEKNIDFNKIIFFPSDNDELLFKLYKNAYALIYPSMYEGFGMPILEAMALGCPVISSNSSSLPEVYGDAALSFSPLLQNDLSNKLDKIVSDQKLREKLINLGYLQTSKFSWKNCAKETLSLYKRII